jgi:hypothetical protein
MLSNSIRRLSMRTDRLVKVYEKCDKPVQGHLRSLVEPLTKALGMRNPVFLDIIATCEPEADSLVMKMVYILTESGIMNRPVPVADEQIIPSLYRFIWSACSALPLGQAAMKSECRGLLFFLKQVIYWQFDLKELEFYFRNIMVMLV